MGDATVELATVACNNLLDSGKHREKLDVKGMLRTQ